MKKLKYIALCVLLMIFVASPVLALSDISGAKYYAPITISNNGTIETNVATTANISTANLIAGNYLNATANNTVVRNNSGADVKFQPGYTDANLWSFFVPSIGANSYLTYILRTANSTGGEIRYFPGADGMYTVSDNITLGVTDNFTISQKGWVDSSTYYGNQKFVYKPEAFVTHKTASDNITSGIISAESYELTPLTTDAAWHSVDVSNYVDPRATGVILEIYDGTASNFDCAFRKTGSTDDRYYDIMHTWVAIGLDATQSFDYKIANAALDVYIRGYTLPDYWTFNTNAVDISLPGAVAWADIDLSVGALVPVGTEGVIIEIINTGAIGATGLRMKGSADARIHDIEAGDHVWAIVGCNANRVIEGYAAAANIDFFLVGYITDGATFKLNATDISLAGAGAWTDMDLSASAPDGTFALIENITNDQYGFRRNGITGAGDSLYQFSSTFHTWSFVELDRNQIMEGKIAGLAFDSFLVGYITEGVKHADTVTYTYSASVSANVTSGEYTVLTYGGPVSWWDSNWERKETLTFDNTASAINLVDFPVLIYLNSTNFDFSAAQANGEDIRFIDNDDATELKYLIDDWDVVSELATIWVKVTQIDATSATDYIHMYWGNPIAVDDQDPEFVFGGYETISNCEATADWAASGNVSVRSVDAGIFHEGAGSIKDAITANAGVTYTLTYNPAGSWNFTDAGSTIDFWFRSSTTQAPYTSSRLYLYDTDADNVWWDLTYAATTWTNFFKVIDNPDGEGGTFNEAAVNYFVIEIVEDGVAVNFDFWVDQIEHRWGAVLAGVYKDSTVGTINDATRYGNDGTITGATWAQDTKGLWYLSFDGATNKVDYGNSVNLQTTFGGDTTGDYTYLWWQKRPVTDNDYRAVFKKNLNYLMGWYSSNLYFNRTVTTTTNEANCHWLNVWEAADANAWVSFALTVSGRALAGTKLYKNATLKAKSNVVDTLSANIANTGDSLQFPGVWYSYFKGFMTLDQVYNYTLSTDWIEANNLAFTDTFITYSNEALYGLRIYIGVALGGVAAMVAVPDNANDWIFVENYSMLYLEEQEITVGGGQAQYIEWEYDSVFHDQSVNINHAYPSFRTGSSDADVSANMTGFFPVAEAKAPAYALSAAPPFITHTPNITGTFTTVPPAGTFPLAGVITALANATATPPQLPLLIIAVFVMLAVSLSTSATIRLHGSGSINVKIVAITSIMGIFVALGNFGIDFWMVFTFLVLAIALAMASRQLGWN